MSRYRQRDAAPLATLPADHALRSVSRCITWLVTVFFGLGALFFVLTAVADSTGSHRVSVFVWGRGITELILGSAYFLFAYLWRRGKFWGYLRLLMTSGAALVSAVSVVVLAGTYPWWLRFEQALQVAVILVLFYVLTRPAVRRRFANKGATRSP